MNRRLSKTDSPSAESGLARELLKEAQSQFRDAAGWEEILATLARAIQDSEAGGDRETRADALLLRAHGLIALVEYDEALRVLEAARGAIRSDTERVCRARLLEAAVLARRSQREPAAKGLAEAILSLESEISPGVALGALLEALQANLLSPLLLETGRLEISRLLESSAPEDAAAIPQGLRQRAEALLAIDLGSLPKDIGRWLDFSALDHREAALRTSIARLEQRGEASVPLAECWQNLWRHLHDSSADANRHRLLDLAAGFRSAADRSDSAEKIALSWQYLGASLDLAGHPQEAADTYQKASEIDLDSAPEWLELGGEATTLGQLPMARWRLGEALSRYEEKGDVAGYASVLSQLARVEEATAEKGEATDGSPGQESGAPDPASLERAIHLHRQALTLRRRLGDVEESSIALSELARLHFAAAQLGPAIDAASQGLKALDGRPAHRARLVCLTYLALALAQSARWNEAQIVARRRQRERQAVTVPEDPNIELVLQELADQAPDTEGAQTSVDQVQTMARRLGRLGLVDEAIERLDTSIDAIRTQASPTPGGRDRDDFALRRAKAQILLETRRFESARELYLEIADRCHGEGGRGPGLEARRQAALCESHLGRHGAAETRLRDALLDEPAGPLRGLLLRTLATVLQARATSNVDLGQQNQGTPETFPFALGLDREGQAELGPDEIQELAAEAVALLEEAVTMPGTEDEDKGLHLLNLAITQAHLVGDDAAAKESLAAARALLLDTVHRETCDRVFEALEVPN